MHLIEKGKRKRIIFGLYDVKRINSKFQEVIANTRSNSSLEHQNIPTQIGRIDQTHGYCCQVVTHQSANYFRVSTNDFRPPFPQKIALSFKKCPPRVLRWFVNYRFAIRNRSTLRSCASQWYYRPRETDRGGSIIIIIIWDCLQGSAQHNQSKGILGSRIHGELPTIKDIWFFSERGPKNGLVLKNETVRVADPGHNTLKYNLMGCARWKTVKCKIPLVSDTLLKHHQLNFPLSGNNLIPFFGNSVNFWGVRRGMKLAHFDWKCIRWISSFL